MKKHLIFSVASLFLNPCIAIDSLVGLEYHGIFGDNLGDMVVACTFEYLEETV